MKPQNFSKALPQENFLKQEEREYATSKQELNLHLLLIQELGFKKAEIENYGFERYKERLHDIRARGSP